MHSSLRKEELPPFPPLVNEITKFFSPSRVKTMRVSNKLKVIAALFGALVLRALFLAYSTTDSRADRVVESCVVEARLKMYQMYAETAH